MSNPIPDVITVAELDAMSDEDFAALFPGGPALAGLIASLGQAPQCPDCLNPKFECICDQLESA